jgi:hypothetical protein
MVIDRLRRLTAPRWDLGEIDVRQEGHLYWVFVKLAKMGLGPRDQLEVRHCFYVTSVASAERVRIALEGQGYTTSAPRPWAIHEPPEEEEWEMFATRVQHLSIEGMRAVEAEFHALMLAEGGDYDGWNAWPVLE